ncbi:MAG: BCCT family transporter [Myxococcales bacterium]|nr:MAG: BCCT family transporter [Myxococcales bacterium]
MSSSSSPKTHPQPNATFVSGLSVFFIGVLLAAALLGPRRAGDFFELIQNSIFRYFSWFYVLSMTGFLLFALWLIFGPYGKLRLGAEDDRPEFSTPTWISMLFSAGMGIGLLFFGVAEPMMHYANAPTMETNKLVRARDAMGLTFFHWGLHAWAVYAVVGLALAYFCFRKGFAFSLRSALYPVLGKRVFGRMGDVIDVLAIVSTLLGVATSLGIGAMQVNSGLHYAFGLPNTTVAQVAVIAGVTSLATLSVVSGLHMGIRRLSELNMALAGLLFLMVLVLGPTPFLLNSFVENIGSYLEQLPKHSFITGSFENTAEKRWLRSWTLFYWAWWIAWAPFVGMFVARVSKGRTIREFVVTVLFVPTLVGFAWFSVFGGASLYAEIHGDHSVGLAVADDMPTAVFVLFESYPATMFTTLVCVISIVLFFVTSSDSASLVVDTLAAGGNEDNPVWHRVFWAVLEGLVAAALLLAGGLQALRTATITSALPFCVIILLMCVGIIRSLRKEKLPKP